MGCWASKPKEEAKTEEVPQQRPTRLSPQELDELYKIFQKIDRDSDGKLSPFELEYILKSLGLPVMRGEITGIYKQADNNRDGRIDFDDFVEFACTSGQDEVEELRAAFKIFDKKETGFITVSDVRQILKNLGQEEITEEEVEDIIAEADADGDGMININEFIEIVKEPKDVCSN